MNTAPINAAMFSPQRRRLALWCFSALLTLWTILGHTVLGFDQPWAAPVVGVLTAVFLQFLLEWVDAKAHKRQPRFLGRSGAQADFVLPAIIPGLACAMLVYSSNHLWPVALAVSVAIGSPALLHAPAANGRAQHIFNPSNIGIAATLFLLPWVGIASPYYFTNHVTGAWLWVISGTVLLSGIVVHSRFTARLPLFLAWVAGFLAQALVRHWLVGSSWIAALVSMSSAAFLVFSLYMVPDPATTPMHAPHQALFGFSVAIVYGALQLLHIGSGLFAALAIVSTLRGIALYLAAVREREATPAAVPLEAWTATSGD